MNLVLRFLYLNLIFSLLLASGNAFAIDSNLQPEVLEAKSRLEQTVNKKFHDRISTQLPKDMFSVGVQITLDSENADNSVTAAMELPADVSLGIIDHANDPAVEAAMKKVKIKKVVVLVGLHPKLGEDYKAKFETWLKTNVKSEFGSIGSAQISSLPEIPADVVTEKPAPPRQLNWEERFGNFQNLIGFSVLALLFIIGIVLMKVMPSKDAKERVAVDLRIAEMKDSKIQLEGRKEQKKLENKEKPALENQLNANLLFDNYREHQKKVAFIAMSSQEQIDQVLDLWLSEGDSGKRKIASFVDAVLTHYGVSSINSSLNGTVASPVPTEAFTWQLPEKIKSNKEMPPVFREYALLPMSEKTSYLEQCYWDLLSMKTLDEKALKPRFASLAQLPPAKIQKILSSQDKKVKALTLLNLPEEKIGEVVAEMSFDDKKSIVLQAFESPKVRENELEVLDESLKFLIKKEDTVEEGVIEVKSMIPNMLMAVKPFEEIKLLREICPNLADKGLYLKQSYPSAAFIGEWPKEKLRTLLTGATNPEILSLLQVFPEIKESILEALPPRTKAILQDEIGKQSYSDDDLNLHLEGTKYKIFKMVNDGEVVLTQIFKDPAPESSVKAA